MRSSVSWLLLTSLVIPTAATAKVPAKPAAKQAKRPPPLSKPAPPVTERSLEALEALAPDDARAYATWKQSLSKRERARIHRFCATESAYSSHALCGGIGPLAIPSPPEDDLMPRPKGAPAPTGPRRTRAEWFASLSAAQRTYVRKRCARSEISELCGGTPLVLAFHRERVTFAASAGTFPLRAGDPVATDWPTASTPWLALDRDGNGTIDSGRELFGSGTEVDGAFAKHGFVALAALDDNRDGAIDAADPQFASLLLWADANGDRKSTPDELAPASARVQSISLAYRADARCDARGNCEGERAAMTWRDERGALRTGTVIDVYLRYQAER